MRFIKGSCLALLVAVFVVAGAMARSAAPRSLAAGSRPNVLIIVADDLGYTDLGVFGSEIHTPNLDRLARTGTILTNYYSSPLCAPTRAMLLSGTDHHLAGEGMMGMAVDDAPGYKGYLNHRVVSLATRLQSAGYHTYMAGKWHLGNEADQSPTARGFERSFTLLDGAATHFHDRGGGMGSVAHYRDDGRLVESLPADFYSTTYYTDRMLEYFRSHAATDVRSSRISPTPHRTGRSRPGTMNRAVPRTVQGRLGTPASAALRRLEGGGHGDERCPAAESSARLSLLGFAERPGEGRELADHGSVCRHDRAYGHRDRSRARLSARFRPARAHIDHVPVGQWRQGRHHAGRPERQ